MKWYALIVNGVVLKVQRKANGGGGWVECNKPVFQSGVQVKQLPTKGMRYIDGRFTDRY